MSVRTRGLQWPEMAGSGGIESGRWVEAIMCELKVPSRQRGEKDGVRACTASPTRKVGVSTARIGAARNFFWKWGPMRDLNGPLFASERIDGYYADEVGWGSARDALIAGKLYGITKARPQTEQFARPPTVGSKLQCTAEACLFAPNSRLQGRTMHLQVSTPSHA
jgi:hypothetical protein